MLHMPTHLLRYPLKILLLDETQTVVAGMLHSALKCIIITKTPQIP